MRQELVVKERDTRRSDGDALPNPIFLQAVTPFPYTLTAYGDGDCARIDSSRGRYLDLGATVGSHFLGTIPHNLLSTLKLSRSLSTLLYLQPQLLISSTVPRSI